MLKRFYPDIHFQTIFDIPYDELLKQNKIGLVFDIDNTLVPFDIPEPTEKIIELFTELKEKGFKICLLSNNKEDRVVKFNNKLKLPAISKAKKPGSQGIKKAMALLKTDESQTVQIGDQLFTDVWCGNKLGLYTILVTPVAERDEFTVRLKRGVEKMVLNTYFKKEAKKRQKK